MIEKNHSHRRAILLRDIILEDMHIFFRQQLDPIAQHMAAFTSKDPTDKEAFDGHWTKVMANDSITIKTILYREDLAGYVLVHSWFGEPEISYWVGR